MLEGLDEVDWARLEHAYGKAKDVPRQIRDLTSRRAKKRENALYELHGNIWHQHTVYEATAPAVPFLAEVALAESVPPDIRRGLVLLLAEIADGTSYLDVHGPIFDEIGIDLDEEPGRLQRELDWVRAAHDAVRDRLPGLTSYLGSTDDGFRVAAAYLVAKFPEDADTYVPRIAALHEREQDPARRQTYELVLDALRRGESTDKQKTLLEDVLYKALE